jgi:hypothetical protein
MPSPGSPTPPPTAPSPSLPVGAVPGGSVLPNPAVVGDPSAAAAAGATPAAGLTGVETRTSPALSLPLAVAPELPGVRLYQARLLDAGGNAVADETCLFFDQDGKLLGERRTDRDGRVSLIDFPPAKPSPAESKPRQVLAAFPELEGCAVLVLPDVLEGFDDKTEPSLPWGKNQGKRDDGRRFDPSFHVVPVNLPAVDIRLGSLTQEQKFQYLRWFYGEENATYPRNSSVARFDESRKRWSWPRPGLSCNPHANFFLGFWFNYNRSFPSAASATAMSYLPMLDCSTATYRYGSETRRDRGYSEFVEAVTPAATQYFSVRSGEFPGKDPNKSTNPQYYAHYLRMSQFFTWSDAGDPQLNAAGEQLVRELGDFNVYSVTNLDTDVKKAAALAVVRWWLKQSRGKDTFGFGGADYAVTVQGKKGKVLLPDLTDAQVDGVDDKTLQKILWHLDDSRATDQELLRYLYDKLDFPQPLIDAVRPVLDPKAQAKLQKERRASLLNVDHHGGVVMPRGPAGAPLTPGSAVELWKFSADGRPTKPQATIQRKYTPNPNEFLHLAIWRLKPLRPGGLAPDDDDTSAQAQEKGGVDINALPRFVVAR